MPNPGSFLGTRHAFILDQQTRYAQAVRENWAADCVADVTRRYFKRYPIRLDHSTEPTPEWLAQVDDNAVEPDCNFEGDQVLADLLVFRKEVRPYVAAFSNAVLTNMITANQASFGLPVSQVPGPPCNGVWFGQSPQGLAIQNHGHRNR